MSDPAPQRSNVTDVTYIQQALVVVAQYPSSSTPHMSSYHPAYQAGRVTFLYGRRDFLAYKLTRLYRLSLDVFQARGPALTGWKCPGRLEGTGLNVRE